MCAHVVIGKSFEIRHPDLVAMEIRGFRPDESKATERSLTFNLVLKRLQHLSKLFDDLKKKKVAYEKVKNHEKAQEVAEMMDFFSDKISTFVIEGRKRAHFGFN